MIRHIKTYCWDKQDAIGKGLMVMCVIAWLTVGILEIRY